MKEVFKPLGIAAAVAAASAGYVNVANAQTVASSAVGDLALVPYYTVNGNWITGIHIVNTSDKTQVVKFRFRRAVDSLDALDFNIVMSPKDVYAGFLSDDAEGNISWSANDTTCTVPGLTDGKLTMPPIYRDGAETGYVEIIGMGSPADEDMPIAVAAKHVDGTPRDCAAVRSNFFSAGTSTSSPGVNDPATTWQAASANTAVAAAQTAFNGINSYTDSSDALKVSYFIRDNDSGVEFGDNAVHLQGFLSQPSITNQQFGWLSGDLDGFDFPNLDGTTPSTKAGYVPQVNRFELLRDPSVLGVGQLMNEWTANSANGAALSWVVTMPGQYTMMDTPQFVLALQDAEDGADSSDITCTRAEDCDNRDLPVKATLSAYDREEGEPDPAEEDLTVSPALPGERTVTTLDKEVNVLTFGGNNVLGVSDIDIDAGLSQPYGWLSLAVESQADQAVADPKTHCWDYSAAVAVPGPQAEDADLLDLNESCRSVGGDVPMIGFAAWARNVAANPDASYGRIVAHSSTTSS
jgi:hypothetical protein